MLGGVILFTIATFFFVKSLFSGSKIKIALAALFLAFACLLLFGGLYLQYLVETGAIH